VGFLGWMEWPTLLRVALHLPLAVASLAAGFAVLLGAGVLRHWWTRWIRPQDAALELALASLTIQLGAWHLVGWGF